MSPPVGVVSSSSRSRLGDNGLKWTTNIMITVVVTSVVDVTSTRTTRSLVHSRRHQAIGRRNTRRIARSATDPNSRRRRASAGAGSSGRGSVGVGAFVGVGGVGRLTGRAPVTRRLRRRDPRRSPWSAPPGSKLPVEPVAELVAAGAGLVIRGVEVVRHTSLPIMTNRPRATRSLPKSSHDPLTAPETGRWR